MQCTLNCVALPATAWGLSFSKNRSRKTDQIPLELKNFGTSTKDLLPLLFLPPAPPLRCRLVLSMKHAHHALLLAAVVAGAAPRLAVAATCSTFEPTIPLGCTVVDLRYATIPEAKAALFAAALQNHTTPIAAIELQYSEIGDAVVIAIAGVLRHLPALERLDLRYNAITLAGGQALIAVLENCNDNRALTELRIGYNEFGWRGKIFTRFEQLLEASKYIGVRFATLVRRSRRSCLISPSLTNGILK